MYKLIILGSISSFIIMRNIIPLIWSIIYIEDNGLADKYAGTILILIIYLFIQSVLNIKIMNYIYKKTEANRTENENMLNITKKYDKYGFMLIGIIIIYILFNFHEIPLFMNLGSDSMVKLVESNKIKTWIVYGILEVVNTALIFITLKAKKRNKIIFFIFLIISVIVTGKKSAILALLFNILLVKFIISNKKPKLKIFKLIIFCIIGSAYIIIQYIRTDGIIFNLNSLLTIFDIFIKILYDTSTIYLVQLINLKGLEFAPLYSKSLGDFGVLKYFFNPFIKLIGGTGINKSIGPFLSYQLFGNNFPNGVNPTLFFEFYFVFGNLYASIFAIIILVILYFVMKKLIDKIIKYNNKSILMQISFVLLFISCFSFTIDSLNTIRNLPFYLLPYFLFISKSFLYKCTSVYKKNSELY